MENLIDILVTLVFIIVSAVVFINIGVNEVLATFLSTVLGLILNSKDRQNQRNLELFLSNKERELTMNNHKELVELENLKIKSNMKIQRYSKVLLPILNLYRKNFFEIEMDNQSGEITEYHGLSHSNQKELERIFNENYKIIDIELFDMFQSVNRDFVDEIYSGEYSYKNGIGVNTKYYFDKDLELYKAIKKDAKGISDSYLT